MDTITEFLASIGYGLDTKSTAEFRQTLRRIDDIAEKAALSLLGAAAALSAYVAKSIVALDSAGFAAERLETSTENLRALSYALEQTGLSGAKAGDILGSFASTMRRIPEGSEAIIRSLGVRTREAGKIRDHADMLLDVVDALKDRPQIQASTIAGELGVSEADFNHLKLQSAKIRRFQDEQKSRDQSLGVDRRQGALSSIALMRGYRALQAEIVVLVDLASASIAPALTPVIQAIDAWIKEHRTAIVAAAEQIITSLLALVPRLVDVIASLAPVAEQFNRFIAATVGEKGAAEALGVFGAAFITLIAMRALRVNKAVGLALVALIAAMGLRRHFQDPNSLAPGSGQGGPDGGSSEPDLTGGEPGGVRGFLHRSANFVRRSLGLPEKGTKAPSQEAPDAETGPALDRTRFREELKDPAVRARLLAFTEAEVGNEPANAQQAHMEEVLNRAASRRTSILAQLQNVNQGGYYPTATTSAPYSPRLEDKYGKMLEAVLNGSNISNYATGNASGTVGFAGGYLTKTFGRERFGVEGPDMKWAAQEIRKAQAELKAQAARRAEALATATARDSKAREERPDWARPAPALRSGLISSPWDDEEPSVIADRTTKITVHGDSNPHRTAAAVSSAQTRVNSDMIQSIAEVA